jgi:hypothetical protein
LVYKAEQAKNEETKERETLKGAKFLKWGPWGSIVGTWFWKNLQRVGLVSVIPNEGR